MTEELDPLLAGYADAWASRDRALDTYRYNKGFREGAEALKRCSSGVRAKINLDRQKNAAGGQEPELRSA